MDEDGKEAVEIRPSVTMSRAMEEARSRPLEVFDSYPIHEIRAVCIKALEDRGWHPDRSEIFADWAEYRIRALIAHKDPMWERILHWYVFNAGWYDRSRFYTKISVRAVEFAIGLAGLGSDSIAGEAGHCVSARLQRDPMLYWLAPSMKEFLEMALLPRREQGGRVSVSWRFGWPHADRAIRRITEAGDVTFLPLIQKLAGEDEWAVPVPADPFGPALQSAVLRGAAEILAEARDKQTPDLNATVGAWLRKEGGLQGSVSVIVEHPERVKVGEKLTLIRVFFMATRADEVELLFQILPRLEILWEGEGFDPVGRVRGEIAIDTASGGGGVVMTMESRGQKRFWIHFFTKAPQSGGGAVSQSRETIATMAGYVFIE